MYHPAAVGGAYLPALGQTRDEVTEAGEYVERNVSKLSALTTKLAQMQHRAAVILGTARRAGDTETEREAQASFNRIAALRIELGRARDRYDAMRGLIPGWLPGLGNPLPVIPIAVGASVIALAAAMYAIFRKTSAQEQILNMLERGQITHAEAERLMSEAAKAPTGLFAGVTRLTGGLGMLAIAVPVGMMLLRRGSA